ncbi:MAG TPA: 5-(carboxyamino)imidazole ribonucleotide mutase [Clostridiales bacterium]|nr:5-(carboxyamino)imidazole ribonucleotide mutase [Clostridiales bacterium]
MKKNVKVGILMGSDSDLHIMKGAADVLEKLNVEYEMTVISAHRMPDVFFDYARSAEERGLKIIIAGAGGAAHLPGMSAAIFPMPVIGVPIHTKSLAGVDSLYSIVQMPSGIPVATVSINGATNAGLLAAKILATSDPILLDKLKLFAKEQKESVLAKAEKLDKLGHNEYLKQM